MAGTGLVFVGFVLLHMYGNLKLLSGEAAYNSYAEHLRTFGEPILPYGGFLWILRVVLIACLVGHLYAAFSLWAAPATRAGPATSAVDARRGARPWMRWGGVAILLFLIWHLLEFTIIKVSVEPRRPGPDVVNNPYQLVVASFQVPWLDHHLRARDGRPRACTSRTASSARSRPSAGPATPPAYRRAKAIGHGLAAVIARGVRHPAARDPLRPHRSEALTMTDTTVERRHRPRPVHRGRRRSPTPRRPAGPDRRQVDHPQVRGHAGQPGQPPQARRHHRRHRAGRRRRRGDPRRGRLQRQGRSATRTPRAARTRSPPRAASTPRRTTRRTATPSTGSSTTRSRAATTAPASPTSTGWPRSAPTSSTSASPRACPSPASTAACSTTARSAASRCRAPSTPAARPASSC